MAVWGLDIEQVRTLASKLNQQATYITNTLIPTITSQTSSTQWVGPDGDDFRNDWTNQIVPSLRKVATQLQDHAARARRDADAQERVSRTQGG